MQKYTIRIQVIATANDDGSDAANITPASVTTQMSKVSEILSPSNVEFLYDKDKDFLKINSSLLNREFTLLELPNVGKDKWDHKPAVDSESHSKARDAVAKQFAHKLVIMYRNRKKLDEDDDGNWYVANKGGGSSGSNAYFVNMSTSSGSVDLAHEIGHFLQLPHPFVDGVGTIADAAAKIKAFVEDGASKDDGLLALDGDRHVLLDTPADCKGSIFEDAGLELCGPDGEIDIAVNFSDGNRTYTLAPDRNLVMSYFKSCSQTGDKTISPQQARRIRDGLEFRNRQSLISISPGFNYGITRGGSATGGNLSDLGISIVRAGRVALAVIDGSGDLKVIVYDIEDNGKKIIRKGDITGGGVKKVSICPAGLGLVATAVITKSNTMKLIMWKVNENGTLTRKGDAVASGEVKDVACCAGRCNLGTSYIYTAVKMNDGSLKVASWLASANGDVSLAKEAAAGKVNIIKTGLTTPRLSVSLVGAGGLLVNVRDEENKLRAILWEFDGDNNLIKRESHSSDELKPGALAGCQAGREVSVTAFQDKDKNLKLRTYGFPDDARFMEERGSATAGGIKDVDICRIGTEMAVTAVRLNSDKLKIILWGISKTGHHITRLADVSPSDTFSKIAVCQSDRNKFVTAMRDLNGNLKVVSWNLTGLVFAGKPLINVTEFLESNPKPQKIRSLKIAGALGGECSSEL